MMLTATEAGGQGKSPKSKTLDKVWKSSRYHPLVAVRFAARIPAYVESSPDVNVSIVDGISVVLQSSEAEMLVKCAYMKGDVL